MLALLRATVTAIERVDDGAVTLRAQAEGEDTTRRAIAFSGLVGLVSVGDVVLLNVTATRLALGTGGFDFVVAVEGRPSSQVFGEPDGTEHIVKLRYTPHQHAIRAVEMALEHELAWRAIAERDAPLAGTSVVVCGLHSQIAPVAAGVKASRPDACIVYVMTDAGALPLALSKLVRDLKTTGLIGATVTAGQAFGGDYEAVTLPSALIAARHIANADVIIVSQGPGNAGTGTRYGFSGIEQGSHLDTVGALGGNAIGVLRLSTADARERHDGLSHHSVTALGLLASRPAVVAFPIGDEWTTLRETVLASPIATRHTVVDADGKPGLELLAERGIRVTSMGRGVAADPIFFHAAAAAGLVAAAVD